MIIKINFLQISNAIPKISNTTKNSLKEEFKMLIICRLYYIQSRSILNIDIDTFYDVAIPIQIFAQLCGNYVSENVRLTENLLPDFFVKFRFCILLSLLTFYSLFQPTNFIGQYF